MPKYVDHDQRRRDILSAAGHLLAEHGMRGMSIASIAARLGGSSTIVTHFYPTIGELLDDLAARIVAGWHAQVDALTGAHADPRAQLRAVLFEWLTPLEGDSLAAERVRFSLLGDSSLSPETQRLLDSWEAGMRDLFRRCVRPLVEEAQVEPFADVLRVTFNGIALSTVEHPDYWTPDRQRAVLETVVTSLGLLDAPRAAKRHQPRPRRATEAAAR